MAIMNGVRSAVCPKKQPHSRFVCSRNRSQIPGLDLAGKETVGRPTLSAMKKLPSINQRSRQGRPKHEIRNPKQTQMAKFRMVQTASKAREEICLKNFKK
jgi:hypothetical protein